MKKSNKCGSDGPRPPVSPALGLDTKPTRACQEAERAWALREDEEGLAKFATLARNEPGNLRSLTVAAKAFASRYRLEDVERIIGQMQKLGEHSGMVLFAVGEVFRQAHLTEQAVACFEGASADKSCPQNVWFHLATYYQKTGDTDKARAALDRVAEKSAQTEHLLASIERSEGDTGAAFDRLRRLADSLPDQDANKSSVLGELASLADANGEYAQAVKWIERAKQIQIGLCRAEFEAANHGNQKLAEFVDSLEVDDLQRPIRQEGLEPLDFTPLLLSGFPRSGTTLLEQMLDAHSDMVSSEEIDYFSKEIFTAIATRSKESDLLTAHRQVTVEELNRFRSGYRKVMEHYSSGSLSERSHLDKNPGYNLIIPTFLRVFPESRLLIALRDPRDVILSCYLRYLPINPFSVTFLSMASTLAKYQLDMTAWLKISDQLDSNWLEIKHEDLLAEPETCLRRVTSFLDLHWQEKIMDYRSGLSRKLIHSPSHEQVKSPLNTKGVGRWKNYRFAFEKEFEQTAPFLEAFGYE